MVHHTQVEMRNKGGFGVTSDSLASDDQQLLYHVLQTDLCHPHASMTLQTLRSEH